MTGLAVLVVNTEISQAHKLEALRSCSGFEVLLRLAVFENFKGVRVEIIEEAALACIGIGYGKEVVVKPYLGVGAVFPTGSKDDAVEVSHETLKAICEAVSIPVVAIGGITVNNTPELAGSGICGIAVISAIYGQKDIYQATVSLKKVTEEMVRI